LGACLGHCPQGALKIIEREANKFDEEAVKVYLKENKQKQQKTNKIKIQWPIQLNLVSTSANFLKNSDILLAADCVPAAYPDFHSKLISEKILLIGCPKFDDAMKYATKLGEILMQNNIKSITVAHMEVPCCSGLKWIAQKAVETSNKSIPIKNIMIGVNGEIK
jgi:hypothetical protein